MKTRLSLLLAVACATPVLALAAIPPDQSENIRGLVRDRRFNAAEIAVKALLAAHPAEAEAQALLASVRRARNDATGAVQAAEKAVELDPTSSTLQLQLGDTYGFAARKAGMLSMIRLGKKCLVAYEKAVALDPANLEARSSLMTVYQQAPSMMGGGTDKAYEQAAAIRRLDAGHGHVAYAQLYAAEKKYAEAFAELEAVLQAAPDDYAALYQFGRLTALSGERIDRGLAALKKCLALPPPPDSPGLEAVHWRLGNLWEKKGDKQAARAAYEAALAVAPDFPQASESLKKLQ